MTIDTTADAPYAGAERRDPEQAAIRRRLEELVALRTAELATAKEAAEAALAAKGAFLARMSHEIRTPMNTIIGLSHIMLRDVGDPRMRRQIDKVLESAEHLLALIDDILELSRLEAGKVELVVSDFSPKQVADGVFALIGSQARDKGLSLAAEFAPDVPRVLQGDVSRVRQLLLNYATNAVKFTQEGEVRLSARVVAREGDRVIVRFAVTDTGIGLTPEQRDRVFDVFEQADGGRSRRAGGTGLGLALVLRVAQLMGGKVGVDSQLGRGSTFWFEGPFGIGATAAAHEVHPGGTEETGMFPSLGGALTRRVLLVDDHEFNLELAETLLRMEGYEVDVAHDGIEAVAMARENRYGAILMDVQMRHMDGLEATREIRKLARHAATPIIAMTASVFEEDRRVCLDAGMNDLVAKPIDPRHLQKTLQRWAPMAAQAARQSLEATAEAKPAAISATVTLAAPASSDVRSALLALQELVASDDLGARDFLRTVPPQVGGASRAELDRLLDVFDYEAAGLLIAQLLDQA